MRLGVYIGRFQPFHLGHLHVVQQALAQCDRLLILIGSAGEPRTVQNPWTWQERDNMIRSGIPGDIPDVIDTGPICDFATNQAWVASVRAAVRSHLAALGEDEATTEVSIAGHAKDHTSYYLRLFPEWGSIEVGNFRALSATPMRELFFEHGQDLSPGDVGTGVRDWTEEWLIANGAAYGFMVREFAAVRQFRKPWQMAPHPPTFVTTDALVIQGDDIALVQRGRFPGRGLRAMPGGFLEPDLSILDNCLKEFSEEALGGTSAEVMRPWFQTMDTFDAPGRDPRGRFITHVLLFVLPDGTFPQLVGGDDAEWAGWVPLETLARSEMAFDHYRIIRQMTARFTRPLTRKAA